MLASSLVDLKYSSVRIANLLEYPRTYRIFILTNRITFLVASGTCRYHRICIVLFSHSFHSSRPHPNYTSSSCCHHRKIRRRLVFFLCKSLILYTYSCSPNTYIQIAYYNSCTGQAVCWSRSNRRHPNCSHHYCFHHHSIHRPYKAVFYNFLS